MTKGGGILTSLLSYVFTPSPGQTEENPLQVDAVPGLVTLLDVALFESNEGQLTATICSSHALLTCWLEVKYQSQLLLQSLCQEEDSAIKLLCESFARQSLESAMDAIERLTTDKFAQSANLSDPYDSISSTVATHHHNLLSGVGAQGIATGILESKDDTGRRDPNIQRRRDCWESPRLFCPDHVWADDAYSSCQRWIRNLTKHSYIVKEKDNLMGAAGVAGVGSGTSSSMMSSSGSSSMLSGLVGGGGNHHQGSGDGSSSASFYSSSTTRLGYHTERQASLLVHLVQDDLPIRLLQFRQAMEAEGVVTKRLYLVKCEYRAPFRAFLEAHQAKLRAPPLELVNQYLLNKGGGGGGSSSTTTTTSSSSAPSTGSDGSSSSGGYIAESADTLKSKFQSMLRTPVLVELFALEKECEQIELDMGQALFPFTELARSLDHKRARLKAVPGIVDESELPSLNETVRRLKSILCRKGGPETSTGIRPILLDLQGVPRDDQIVVDRGVFDNYDKEGLEERVDFFLWELNILSNLVKTKNAFFLTSTGGGSKNQSNDIDFSFSIVKGCTEQFDDEMLKCQLMDWFTIVEYQHKALQKASDFKNGNDLAEEIRKVEINMSIAGASTQNLTLVKERLEMMRNDREQRLAVLQEMVEEVCLREMNLHVHVNGPHPRQTLVLKETSAQGFLGAPMQLAGEPLPLG